MNIQVIIFHVNNSIVVLSITGKNVTHYTVRSTHNPICRNLPLCDPVKTPHSQEKSKEGVRQGDGPAQNLEVQKNG